MIAFWVIAWLVIGIIVASVMVRVGAIPSHPYEDEGLEIIMSIIIWPLVLVCGLGMLLINLVLWLGGDR